MSQPSPAPANPTRRGSAHTAGRVQAWARSHGTVVAGGAAVLGVGAFALYRAHENAVNGSSSSAMDTSSSSLPAAAGVATDSGTGYSSIPDGVDPASLNAVLSGIQTELTAIAAAQKASTPLPTKTTPAPAKSTPPPAKVTGVSTSTRRYYTVAHGDTLSKIASKYHLSLSALEKLNPQIKNPNLIYAGQHVYTS